MADDFKYDVFVSHSSKDKDVVRTVAERLRTDGLKVWLDEWELKPGDHVQAKIEEGLENSRVLLLCMSANAFGSDWAQLEAVTFRFRDPLNNKRRFILLRLDEAPIKGSLAQFLYLDWHPANREEEYTKLLEACRRPVEPAAAEGQEQVAERTINLNTTGRIWDCAFSSDGTRALSGSDDNTVRVWDVETGRCLRVLEGHTNVVWRVAWSPDQRRALSGAGDNTVRVWDVETGSCLRELKGHTEDVSSVAWSADQRHALSGSGNQALRLWDLETSSCVRTFEGHNGEVWAVALSADQRRALSGGSGGLLRLWNAETGSVLGVLEGHTDCVFCVEWGADQRSALSGAKDNTVRVWDTETGRCLRVLKGHTGWVGSVAWSADQRRALSGSNDNTMRIWDVQTGRCLCVFRGHTGWVQSVAWSADQRRALSADIKGYLRVWDISEFVAKPRAPGGTASVSASVPDQIQYTNAKVLLVGESGVGKTGLSKRLALDDWQPSDSTVGAWATQWKLPVDSGDGVEREIWLWDFGGQADQRLIHQLYMDETALAVLVFDGQKEDLFETLGQWDRDLTGASRNPFTKLLVAGRVDAGGLRVSRSHVESFAKDRGYTRFMETSAKANIRCEDLKQAILDGIPWESIPWRSTPLLFKRLKEEIVRLKDEGRVLMRFKELRETLQLRLMETQPSEVSRFTDEELRAVVSLLAGPGVVWELKFGSWVLLQPERINAYAQAVIQTMRADKHERGCLPEERVLSGNLTYHSSMARLTGDEERFVLLAMHQTLVERGLCLREHTDEGTLLIFPSYYRRERPELVGHPAVLVSYRFHGFVDDIYATLVVRLHHTKPFDEDQLWRYAADFKTLSGRQLGVKLTRRPEGKSELEVYFDPAVEVGEKIIFSKYVHEHLLRNAKDVVRLRHYVCPHCGTTVGNREVAMKRLEAWLENNATEEATTSLLKGRRNKSEKPTIICQECEKRVPLWDDLEQHFASAETKQRVRELEEQSAIVLDNESKERALVGEVISTVALAGQLSREFNVSDHGIDMEIEFKSDDGEATGSKLYLQLKSGDSYLRERKTDGAEIFKIKDERHSRYWMAQEFPVLLVIRNSEGAVRWMEVRDWLKNKSHDGRESVNQIEFEGERFDVMSVRRWRDRVWRQGLP
jgi:small GTP-binding protein